MPTDRTIRRDTHAGSWYAGEPHALKAHVQDVLSKAQAAGVTRDPRVKSVICPHAGFFYSSDVAAFSFGSLDPSGIERVFVLGPLHSGRCSGFGLPEPSVMAYRTPLGDLPLDLDVLKELRGTRFFETVPLAVDEAEHSLELQLPFLAELFSTDRSRPEGHPGVRIIPIVIGPVREKDERSCGEILAPYLDSKNTVLVISSDFCHWGKQFDYMLPGSPELAVTYRAGPHRENALIEGLDRDAMDSIEKQDRKGFRDHMLHYQNTICGSHAILTAMEALTHMRGPFDIKFLQYKQSSAMPGAPSPSRSSVSYAAATIRSAS